MLAALTKLLRLAGALCLITLLIVVVIVILSTKMKFDATWASGLSSFLLAWTVMLGGALAYAEKSHLGLDIIVEKFDPATRHLTHQIGHLLILTFAITIMIYGGTLLTQQRYAMGQTIPTLGISKAYFYLSVPLSGILIALTALAHLSNKKCS